MWQLLTATQRERRTLLRKVSFLTKRSQHALALQLDYYMSPQFAGVASALVSGGYAGKGIDVSFLPTCPVGLEQQNVRQHQDANPSVVTMGSVEQNIFIPLLAFNPSLKTTAVAAMFHQSPLCLASLKDLSGSLKIGAHEDTVELLERIFPEHEVIGSPRASKNTDLLSGDLCAIQAYTTTEVPTLRRKLGHEPVVTPLEGLNGTKLGYSQVLFTADECLEGDKRQIVQAFLEATFDGWSDAIRNPEQVAEMVQEAKKKLGLSDESNDHWYPSSDFEVEMLQKCSEYVKGTYQGDRYGFIDPDRWSEANDWLLQGKKPHGFGLDPDVWKPSTQLLSGSALGRKILDEAKTSATSFKNSYGRKPSLAVITVGELERYTDAHRRLQIYGQHHQSWFSKTATGAANGFDVVEINLDASTTTEELLSQIYAQRNVDGIQLMWPLPDHIDSAKVYSAINVEKDVDGIHYVGQREIGNKSAYAPVTPAATLALIKENGIEVKGKRALVIGKGTVVGSPIAQMLRDEGGAVTVAHSGVDEAMLKNLVAEADIIVTCAGKPGLVKADWIDGAVVINVGTTFNKELDKLVSDVDGDIAKYASKYSPVPGGIGPLSVPILFQNVAKAAWDQMDTNGNSSAAVRGRGWNKSPSTLRKVYHYKTYSDAIEAAKKLDEMSSIMDHHANLKFTHNCVNGVDLELEYFTYEADELTQKDYHAALAVDMMLGSNQVQMERYTYNLKEESIAKYPANPRGSSKLLRLDEKGKVTYYENFSNSFEHLAKNCHLVFNNSKVMDARLFIDGPLFNENIELMILDLGSVDVSSRCNEIRLNSMIRSCEVKAGDKYLVGNSTVVVDEVIGIWEEDEKSDGNGTECYIRIQSDLSLDSYLSENGSVPIPPYLHRPSEKSDKERYNNVYAQSSGSVAAPTAGLHFTENLLEKLGSISNVCLHVGAGTFKPVLAKDARDHSMHAEIFSVSVKEIKSIIDALKNGKDLIAVGTTSSRTLESLFWCGVKKLRGLEVNTSNLKLEQFEWVPLGVVANTNSISRINALEAIIDQLDDNVIIAGQTSLMITPPIYQFRVVDHLVTNFHAPDSTLMLLVSAFIHDDGVKLRGIYENAQENGFRFLSYGDSCMLSPPKMFYNSK